MTEPRDKCEIKALRLPLDLIRRIDEFGARELPGSRYNFSMYVRHLLTTHPGLAPPKHRVVAPADYGPAAAF